VVLGAPDTLLDGADPAHAAALARVEALAAEGGRVVVLALAPGGLPAGDGRPQPLTAVALVAIHDEIRPDIAQTMRALSAAGVDVKVISGDQPQTVRNVAVRSGIPKAPGSKETGRTRMRSAAFAA